MIATLEQTQREMPRLLELVAQGERIVITVEGRPVAKLTGLAKPSRDNLEQWLAKLDRLRARTATGNPGPSVEEILADDRGV
jgi:prevent-host-death family protein